MAYCKNKHYEYCGPVLKFGNVIQFEWKTETWARSKKKALSNLAYRFKRDNNMVPSTVISLPGKLTEVEERSIY